MSEKASTSAGSAATSSDPAAAYRPAGTSLMADTRAIATAEPWLTALAGAPRPPRSKDREAIGATDTRYDNAPDAAHLTRHAPPAPEGAGGDLPTHPTPDHPDTTRPSEAMPPTPDRQAGRGEKKG